MKENKKKLHKKRILMLIALTMCMLFQTVFTTKAYAAAQVKEMTGSASITTDSLNVRSGPGKEFESIGKVYPSDTLEITGISGNWYRIDYHGEEGYVSSGYVSIKEDSNDQTASQQSSTDADAETTDEFTIDQYKIPIMIGMILIVLIIIFLTFHGIKKLDADDYDDDEDDYDDEDDDEDEEDYDDEDEDDDDYNEDEEEEYDHRMKRRSNQKNRNHQKNVSTRRYTNAGEGKESRNDIRESNLERENLRQPYEQQDLYDLHEGVNEKKLSQNAATHLTENSVRRMESTKRMSNNPDDYRIDIDPIYFEDDRQKKTGTPNSNHEAEYRKEEQLREAMKKMDELQKQIDEIKHS